MDIRKVHQYKREILNLLLKKYERSQSFLTGIPSKQRPQMTLAGSELAKDYYDEMDYRKREWIHAALQELSYEGIVEVTWPKFKENIEVGKIYLNFDGIDEAYKQAGQRPKSDKIDQLRKSLAPLAHHPWEWVRTWWAEIDPKLQERKSAGFDLDDLQGYKDMVQVLLALPELEESVPKRVLSQTLFLDSKRFEQGVERRLLSLLRKIYPAEFEKDEEYLDQIGIVENPKLTQVCGPLILGRVDGYGGTRESEKGNRKGNERIDLSIFPGGLALSTESVKELSIVELPVHTILLIENLTTYNEVIQAPEILPSPVLFIYTGGFPHKSLQKLLKKIATFLDEAPGQKNRYTVYHWGDIDYGGIQIFEYLKRNFFPVLKPYRMDRATYLKYVNQGLSFSEDQALKIEQLLADPSYEDWKPVLHELLKYRKRVEQESIPVQP